MHSQVPSFWQVPWPFEKLQLAGHVLCEHPAPVHICPSKAGSFTLWHLHWPVFTLHSPCSTKRIEQSLPLKPSSHVHFPSLQKPWSQHAFGQPTRWQACPTHPAAQSHLPSAQTPWPEQLRGHATLLHAGPVQPEKHLMSTPLSKTTPCSTYRVAQSRPMYPVAQVHLPFKQSPWPLHWCGQEGSAHARPVQPWAQKRVP